MDFLIDLGTQMNTCERMSATFQDLTQETDIKLKSIISPLHLSPSLSPESPFLFIVMSLHFTIFPHPVHFLSSILLSISFPAALPAYFRCTSLSSALLLLFPSLILSFYVCSVSLWGIFLTYAFCLNFHFCLVISPPSLFPTYPHFSHSPKDDSQYFFSPVLVVKSCCTLRQHNVQHLFNMQNVGS